MAINSCLVIGTICLSTVLLGFSTNAGFVGIQLDTWQNRKNARVASSFFLAAKFLFVHVARNARRLSTSKSEMNTRPRSSANARSRRNNKRNLYNVGSRKSRACASSKYLSHACCTVGTLGFSRKPSNSRFRASASAFCQFLVLRLRRNRCLPTRYSW